MTGQAAELPPVVLVRTLLVVLTFKPRRHVAGIGALLLPDWKYGGYAASLAIDSQQFAYDFMALTPYFRLSTKRTAGRCQSLLTRDERLIS